MIYSMVAHRIDGPIRADCPNRTRLSDRTSSTSSRHLMRACGDLALATFGAARHCATTCATTTTTTTTTTYAVWYARARDGRWNDVCVDDDDAVGDAVGVGDNGVGVGSHAVAHDEGDV